MSTETEIVAPPGPSVIEQAEAGAAVHFEGRRLGRLRVRLGELQERRAEVAPEAISGTNVVWVERLEVIDLEIETVMSQLGLAPVEETPEPLPPDSFAEAIATATAEMTRLETERPAVALLAFKGSAEGVDGLRVIEDRIVVLKQEIRTAELAKVAQDRVAAEKAEKAAAAEAERLAALADMSAEDRDQALRDLAAASKKLVAVA